MSVSLATCCLAQMSLWQWPSPAAVEMAASGKESHLAHASAPLPWQPLLDDCLRGEKGVKAPLGRSEGSPISRTPCGAG